MRFKNEAVVGAVVLLAVILVLFGSFWLAGRQWGVQHVEVVAAFREVGELREGNPVNYRGVRVGQVTGIRLGPLGDGVFVTMAINEELDLPPDVGVVVSPVSLFGDWQAQIVSQSAPAVRQLEFTVATVPDVLPGAALPDMSQLTAVAARIADQVEVLAERVELAFTEETAIKLRQAVGDVSEITAQISGFVDQQTVTYREVSQQVLTATGNITDATATVTRVAQDLEVAIQAGDIQRVMANVSETSENLRILSAELGEATAGVPSLITRADAAMVSFSELAEDVRQTLRILEPQLEEIGPTLAQARQAMVTLDETIARFGNDEGTLARLADDPALYEETQAAIVTLRRLMADIQAEPGRYLRNIRLLGR